jgi:hypothetical protein
MAVRVGVSAWLTGPDLTAPSLVGHMSRTAPARTVRRAFPPIMIIMEKSGA